MLDTTDEHTATADDAPNPDGPEATEDQAEPTEDTTTDETSADDPVEDDKPSKREARYRVQLRETEAERDQLRTTVEALQRAEVERIAGKTIKQPAGLWAAGVALGDLLGDDGSVDTAKVESAATDARASLGLDRAWSAPVVPKEGTSIHQSTGGGNTWEQAFKV